MYIKHSAFDDREKIESVVVSREKPLEEMALAVELSNFLRPPVAAALAARSTCAFSGLDEQLVKFFSLFAVRGRIRDEFVEGFEEVVGVHVFELGVDVDSIRFLVFGANVSARDGS